MENSSCDALLGVIVSETILTDFTKRDLIWWAMRKRAIPEGYVKVIQDMYRGTKTRLKTRCGRTEYFEVKVGLHQGSALSPLLFIIIMDVLAEEGRTKPPWAMLFADDLVVVSETVEEVEEELERWRAVIENKGLRISRSKTGYLVPCHQQGVVKLEGEPLPLNSFKYLGSLKDASGGVWKGCRWTNKSRLVKMNGSIWSYL